MNFSRSLILLGTLLFLSGCTGAQPSSGSSTAPVAKSEPVQAGPIPVKIAHPEKKLLRRVLTLPASIEAFEETPVHARLPGYVKEVKVDIGQPVEKDDLLAELDVPEVHAEARQKTALVQQAEAEIEQAKSLQTAAQAHIETSKAAIREAEAGQIRVQANVERWDSEYKRIASLVEKRVVDAQTLDETRNQLKAASSAKQEVEAKIASAVALAKEADAKLAKAKADVLAAQAKQAVALAEEARLKALVEYSRLKAPFAGVVTKRTIHQGHFVQPAQGANPQPLFVVANHATVRVFLEVPEADALLIQTGLPARLRVASIRDQDFLGKVTRTAWSLDAKTRTLRTEIDLPNDKNKLRPGMYGHVSLTAELNDRWTLPPAAVQAQGESFFAWQIVEGKAKKLALKVGLRDPAWVEIVAKATGTPDPAWTELSTSDAFILNPPTSLAEGQQLTLEKKE